jgi:hypothetical protein
VLIHCCGDVLTVPLRSNERDADRRKHRSSIVARVRFCGNVFTEPLLNNELFRLSGIMSQYILLSIFTAFAEFLHSLQATLLGSQLHFFLVYVIVSFVILKSIE